ncbi:glycerate kinase [Ralstonia mannitolilytica]|uniref:MOFRL family n=1 Tax=Ralstonia mannitolilytica TaxID=105219 RepID=A0AAJ4ZIX0_9RALS|nr:MULTISPECIES: glycerate kinase [Ralstonia]MBU9578337.1 glycerate kinase [Ralstonia mannitolilytica]PLT16767.1 glycerate kinase [Ralstonia mannitolilytica]CAG2142953.1 Putative hydroxypyruvate reductase [Ralstonia mannitolilytica]CAJ0730372.1 Putative hydroxypyruvate reductase [Ralstonia mannitolilytica]SUD86775.1 MOFRL family [Ralstonia mannitolilytica]
MKLDRPGARALLLESYAAAVGAADPLKIVAGFLPPPHAAGKTLVVGAGKAAASMALAVEQAYAGRAQLEGLVVTRYAHGLPTERIRVIEAGHPVPDEAGEQAALEILERVSALTGNDRLIVLVSGGGSSLLSLPADGIPMADLKAVTRELLRCGAPITDMNIVRKHVSRIQGGRLAAASRAPVTTLIVSDVAGDDPSAIASGPTVPDPSTYADALAILRRWGAQMPDTVRTHLERGARGEVAETPKPGDPCFGRVSNHIIATAQQSLQAAAQVFAARGIRTAILGDTVTGEAREVAQVYGALARQIRQHGTPFAAPVALISGGECTVTIPPGLTGGRGGRCAEFLLSLGVTLDGMDNVYALAADTDGIDGSEDNAGALLDPESIARAAARGIAARAALDVHDAYGFFAAADDLIVTGPTRTNVNDYRAILIL